MIHIARELCGGQMCVTPDPASSAHPAAVYRNFGRDGPLALAKQSPRLSGAALDGKTLDESDKAISSWFTDSFSIGAKMATR